MWGRSSCVSVMKNKNLYLALLTMLLWGSLFPAVKAGFAAYDVKSTADILLFAGIRFFLCGAVICIFSAIREPHALRDARKSLPLILLAGFFSVVLHYGFTYVGLQLTDSSKTALLKQVGVLIYVCFSFLFVKEDKPSVFKCVGALLGFLGIAVLQITPGGFSFSPGDILILCASFCTVASNVIGKKVLVRTSALSVTGVSQLFGGGVLLAAGKIAGGSVTVHADASAWIFAYICAASVVSYCLWYTVVKNGELSGLFIIKFAEPVFACVLSALLLGESVWRVSYAAAFLLIGGGIFISRLGMHCKKEEKKQDAPSHP